MRPEKMFGDRDWLLSHVDEQTGPCSWWRRTHSRKPASRPWPRQADPPPSPGGGRGLTGRTDGISPHRRDHPARNRFFSARTVGDCHGAPVALPVSCAAPSRKGYVDSETLGIVAAALFASVAMFQVALAVGAPLGHLAWGGVHEGRLPVNFRINSGLAAIVLLFAAAVVLAEPGVTSWSPVPDSLLTPTIWVLAGLMALNTVGNFASKSAFERWVFGPTAGALAVLCTVIAIGV